MMLRVLSKAFIYAATLFTLAICALMFLFGAIIPLIVASILDCAGLIDIDNYGIFVLISNLAWLFVYAAIIEELEINL